MATETTNYKLKKPEEAEFYAVADFNGNFDIIDAAIAEAAKTGSSDGGSLSYGKMKCGTVESASNVSFAFKEIDTIANDGTDDLTLTFYGEDGAASGTFVLKPGETINDISYSGSKIGFAGTTVKSRYILLGEEQKEE